MKPHAPSQYMIHSSCLFSSLGFWEGVQSATKSAKTWDFIDVLFQIRCSAKIALLPLLPIFQMICNFARLLLEDDLLVFWFCEHGNSASIFLLLLKLGRLSFQSLSSSFLSQIRLLKWSKPGLVSLSADFLVLEVRLRLLHFSIAETYKSNSAPRVGVARVFGFDKYLFISSNACCCGGPVWSFFLFPWVLGISAGFVLLILR